MVQFNEKISICYTCCGPTYRKSALRQLTENCVEHPNVSYCVLTDDKEYFSGVTLQNFLVNSIEDFYDEFPLSEKYEPYLKGVDDNDYAKKFIKQTYKFPYATMRFQMLQAKKFGALNVALLNTDTTINLEVLTEDLLKNKNIIYNAVSLWLENYEDMRIKTAVDVLDEKHNLTATFPIMVFDEAARLYVLEDMAKLDELFFLWNDLVESLYQNGQMAHHIGSYVIHDEFILASIYNCIRINRPTNDGISHKIFNVIHNASEERFWTV